MGWWKIDVPERGQIDKTHNTGSQLLNALPQRDSSENYYNGDGPADAMGDAVDAVLRLLGLPVPRPGSDDLVSGISKAEFLGLFLRRDIPARFSERRAKLLRIIERTWNEIDEQFNKDWNREVFPEERTGVCHFVLNPLFE